MKIACQHLGFVLLGLSSWTSSWADVLVVDAAGGGDFDAFQPAVDGAADGDVLLVEAGSYAAFELAGKGLSIVAAPGATVQVLGGVLVRDVPSGGAVLLAGLTIEGEHAPGTLPHALVAREIAGSLRVERCTLRGADAPVDYVAPSFGGDAARMGAVSDAAFTRCVLAGGAGAESFLGFDASRGGDGLRASASFLTVHDSELSGGDGGAGWLGFEGIPGFGGRGLAAHAGTGAFVAGSTLAGGALLGDDPIFCHAAGTGVALADPGTAGYLLDNAIQGGSNETPCGPDGPAVATTGGATADLIAGSARRMSAPTPVSAATTAVFAFAGEPGDLVVGLVAAQPDAALLLPLHGVLLVAPPLALAPLLFGALPADGMLTVALAVPGLPAGVDSDSLHLQAAFAATDGTLWLGPASNVVVLDPSF